MPEKAKAIYVDPRAFRMHGMLHPLNGQSDGTTASKAMLCPVAVFGVPFLCFPANISAKLWSLFAYNLSYLCYT
jgi:hypothetical protein